MKKRLVILGILIALVASLVLPGAVFAATTADVVITAEGECIAITNTQASWDLGIIAVDSTTKWGASDTMSDCVNAGNVAVNIVITGTDLVGTSTWVLADTAASMIYNIECNDFAGGTAYTVEVKKSVGNTAKASLASAATAQWSMEFMAPTAITELDGPDSLTGTVTLTASKS